MHNRDGKVFFISQFLQFFLPQSISDAVGAAPIRRDQQRLLAWIERFAPLLPPPSDTFHGKFSSLMIDTHVDEPKVVYQIIDSIRNGFAIRQRQKVLDIDFHLFPFGLPLCPVVLEMADQLLFLAVHRNDVVALLLKLLTFLVDVRKLRISVWMRRPFNVLLIGSQRVATRV